MPRPVAASLPEAAPPSSHTTPMGRLIDSIGRRSIRFVQGFRDLVSFFLLILATGLRHRFGGSREGRALLWHEVARSGWQSLPWAIVLALALGWMAIGQSLTLLTSMGARSYVGPIMVTSLIRELGPLAVALLVLVRSGTAQVIELATLRAVGEIDAMEADGVDPLAGLVLPRVTGLALSVLSLMVVFLGVTLVGGYGFAFLQGIPLTPSDYAAEVLRSMSWVDLPLLPCKGLAYGTWIAVASCYHGVARPLRLPDIPGATTRALMQGGMGCLAIDLACVGIYLLA